MRLLEHGQALGVRGCRRHTPGQPGRQMAVLGEVRAGLASSFPPCPRLGAGLDAVPTCGVSEDVTNVHIARRGPH